MALLHRYVGLQDKEKTSVFTFILTKSVSRDSHRDIVTKDFFCSNHKWSLTFSCTDGQLGIYLSWNSPSLPISIITDFTFSLLNVSHYFKNKVFLVKNIKFSDDLRVHGKKNFIHCDELINGQYSNANGEFHFEMCLQNVHTLCQCSIPIHKTDISALSSLQDGSNKLESERFHYGGCNWNIVALPVAKSDPKKLALCLQKLTKFNHFCSIKFKTKIVDNKTRKETSWLVNTFDSEEKTISKFVEWTASQQPRNPLKLDLELEYANAINEVSLTSSVNGSEVIESTCSDHEMQSWRIECDLRGNFSRISISYKDIKNIPKNHLRYLKWNALLIRHEVPSGNETVYMLKNSPYSRYFSHDDTDEMVIMESECESKQISKVSSNEASLSLKVRIEWLESALLFQSSYHIYDDIYKLHNLQMRKEITHLEAKNSNLEKKLERFQKSLSGTHSGAKNEELSKEKK